MTFNPFEAMNTGDWSGMKKLAPAVTAVKPALPPAKPVHAGLKPTPKLSAMTADSCVKYNSSYKTCGCPDFANRGGSYAGLDGRPACKHMVYMQQNSDIAI
jgi:hypothetical protein